VHVDALAVEVRAGIDGVGDGRELHEGGGGDGLHDDANFLDAAEVAENLLNHVDGDGILHVGYGDDDDLGCRGS